MLNGFPRLALIALIASLNSALAAEMPKFEPDVLKSATGEVLPAERATILVPENRRDKASRQIPLRFVRLRSTSATPGNPVVYLAGGPGGSAVGAARGARFAFIKQLRAVGDVILLEQRGAGLSNEIPECPIPRRPDYAKLLDRAAFVTFFRDALSHCLGFWRSKGVDMRGYNTRESADDIDALRQALGAAKLNLVGISYGTHLGMAALKYHEAAIDKAVFAGSEGLDQTVKLPADFDAFLLRVAQAVARDQSSQAAYPDLLATMRRVHARLDAQPAVAKVKRKDGSVIEVHLSSFPIRLMTAFFLIKDPDDIAKLPLVYAGLDAGLYDQVARQLVGGLESQFASLGGMPEAMDLASGISPARARLVAEQARTAILGDAANYPMPHVAGIAPELDLGESFRAAFRTGVPTLFVMGTLDGRTPVESQMRVLPNFANAQRLVAVNGGHDIFEQSEAVQAEIVEFLATGRISRTAITLPPVRFALPPSH